jgi:hypothetical protein
MAFGVSGRVAGLSRGLLGHGLYARRTSSRLGRLLVVGVVVVVVVGVLGVGCGVAFGALEVPVARPVSGVTGDSVVLHGELNPGGAGEVGEYQFEYEPGLVCAPGALFPESPLVALGAAKEQVSGELAGLEPGQTYGFCVREVAGGEEQLSGSVSFSTLATAAPYVPPGSTTTIPGSITPFAAGLEAQVNPEKEATSYVFEYATDEAMTGAKTIPGAEGLPAEFGAFTATVNTGNTLAPNTTYFFRVAATNGTGTTKGPVVPFTTLEAKAPEVTGVMVTGLHSSEPKIEARINPDYQQTSYQFEYSTEETGGELSGTIKTIKGAAPLPAVFQELQAGPAGLPGLLPGPVYYYRVSATNGTGTTVFPVPVQSFQALAGPALSAAVSQGVSRTAATITAELTPQGLPSRYQVAYVPQEAYEPGAPNPYAQGRTTYDTSLPEPFDYSPHPVVVALEELAPGTTYHYTLIAANELGEAHTTDGTFTTLPPTPPTTATGAAENVTQTTATITGTMNTQSLPTTGSFQTATTPTGGAVTPASETGSPPSIALTATLTNLQPATTYYYRTIATNSDGTTQGATMSFTTQAQPLAFTIPPNPAPIPFLTIAQLNTKETQETPKHPAPPTRPELLAKALKACQHKPKHQRPTCRHKAQQKYGPKKKPTKHK